MLSIGGQVLSLLWVKTHMDKEERQKNHIAMQYPVSQTHSIVEAQNDNKSLVMRKTYLPECKERL